MSQPKRERLIRLVPHGDLDREIASFIIDRQARGLSPRTIKFYRDELRFLQAFLQDHGVRSVLDLSPTLLRQYFLDLGKRRNPGGLHAAFRAIRAFLYWYEVEYESQDWSNPIRKVKAPKVPQEPLQPVEIKDLRAMLATCGDRHKFTDVRDKAILLALLDTGCRASEFVALDVADVNLSSGAVMVREGKGGKWRAVFLGTKSRRALARYLRHVPDSGALWRTVTGERLHYEGLRKMVMRRAKRVGVPVPGLHSFRRAFTLSMLRAGADLVSISRLLGHSGLDLIRRYSRQVQDDLAEAHRKAGPVDGLLALLAILCLALGRG